MQQGISFENGVFIEEILAQNDGRARGATGDRLRNGTTNEVKAIKQLCVPIARNLERGRPDVSQWRFPLAESGLRQPDSTRTSPKVIDQHAVSV